MSLSTNYVIKLYGVELTSPSNKKNEQNRTETIGEKVPHLSKTSSFSPSESSTQCNLHLVKEG